MKIAIVLVLSLAAVAAHAAEQTRPVVLITAFGPFDGRGVNGSATLARRLEGVEIGGAVVRTAILPVRWGEPQSQVPKLVGELKPTLCIGLGEGYPNRIAVETTGRNRAEGPDVDGHAPTSVSLEPDGPAERKYRLKFDAAWFTASAVPVSTNDDAGTYLCNDLLYTVLGQPLERVGFVHVPPQGAMADEAYSAVCLPAIKTLIARNLPTAP
jgi:pyrrolidone-carboxylate peptidase